MSYIYADIELTNQIDMIDAKRHAIGEEEIKRIRVRALVDTRAYYLCINETIQKIL